MKTLHLLRHAKSSWDEPGLADRERGLNGRGRRDAPRMGAALALEVEPMVIHASPARRAQLTLEGLCQGWPELAGLAHCTEEALYTFDEQDVLDWIQAYGGDESALFLVGHNPAFTDLINLLCPQWALENLPTAGYARLQLDCADWAGVAVGCGSLERLLRPRELD